MVWEKKGLAHKNIALWPARTDGVWTCTEDLVYLQRPQ